jgi:hypothetical protein
MPATITFDAKNEGRKQGFAKESINPCEFLENAVTPRRCRHPSRLHSFTLHTFIHSPFTMKEKPAGARTRTAGFELNAAL